MKQLLQKPKKLLDMAKWPAPKRGEIVRQIGEALRENKEPLENWFLMKWEKVCRKDMAKYRK